MMMPEGMSGRELAERILADEPDLRVLYTSGYPMEVIGAVTEPRQFLQKPYQPGALSRAVRRCLDGKESHVNALDHSATPSDVAP
jgi:CheY-like chemotaxis protein